MTLNEMRDRAYEIAKSKGWYEHGVESIPTLLCLIHSEVSEALEVWRKLEVGKAADVARSLLDVNSKPIGFDSELADVVIRIGDLCGAYGIDLEKAVREKMAYNEKRPYRHGGKRV